MKKKVDKIKENAAQVIGITAEMFQISGGSVFYASLRARFGLNNTSPRLAFANHPSQYDAECRHTA